MSINELNQKVKRLQELHHMADELSSEMETIQDEIKALMATQDTETPTEVNISMVEQLPLDTNSNFTANQITANELSFVNKFYDRGFMHIPSHYQPTVNTFGCFYKAAKDEGSRWQAVAAAYAYGFQSGKIYQQTAHTASEMPPKS